MRLGLRGRAQAVLTPGGIAVVSHPSVRVAHVFSSLPWGPDNVVGRIGRRETVLLVCRSRGVDGWADRDMWLVVYGNGSCGWVFEEVLGPC